VVTLIFAVISAAVKQNKISVGGWGENL
jgi:hypothetical protein